MNLSINTRTNWKLPFFMRNSINWSVFWILFHFLRWSEMSLCLIRAMMISRVSLVSSHLLFMSLFGYHVQASSSSLFLVRVASGVIELQLERRTSQILLELFLPRLGPLLHRRAELAQCFHYSIINYISCLC